ncbi:MAG: response regulator [Sandaracinaceae bacterium]
MRILLVDDDPRMTRITARVLEKAGFEVESTNHSFGVLNLVAVSRPDVVVIDLKMPGLRGTELLELLRADPELAGTRVVLFSGVVEHELRAYAESANADGYLHKTAGPAALVPLLEAS